jgi:hypothetical protein
LDLPKDIQIVDIKELGNYLAILGVFGRNTSTLEGLCRSHIFFWDTYSPSWNYDYPLEDHVRKLVYDRGKLYAIGEGSGLNLYQLGLDGAVLRESFLATSAAGEALISLDAQRRNTNNLGVGTAALANNGLILIAAKHNNNLHVFSYGSQANVPKVLNKMLFGREAVGTVDIGDILFINARRFYLSWQDDNGAAADDYNLVRLGPTGGQSGAYGDTVELDNYFGGSGRLKTLKKIRLEFDPITSGDYFSLYYTKDYGTSYRFIVDNTGSKTRISNDVASTIQVGSATSYEFLNSEIGLFRQLNLRLYSDYGNPQIRRIIVYWDYADT